MNTACRSERADARLLFLGKHKFGHDLFHTVLRLSGAPLHSCPNGTALRSVPLRTALPAAPLRTVLPAPFLSERRCPPLRRLRAAAHCAHRRVRPPAANAAGKNFQKQRARAIRPAPVSALPDRRAAPFLIRPPRLRSALFPARAFCALFPAHSRTERVRRGAYPYAP